MCQIENSGRITRYSETAPARATRPEAARTCSRPCQRRQLARSAHTTHDHEMLRGQWRQAEGEIGTICGHVLTRYAGMRLPRPSDRVPVGVGDAVTRGGFFANVAPDRKSTRL